MKRLSLSAIAAIAVSAAALAPPAFAADALTGPEITALLSDATTKGRARGGKTRTMKTAADGGMTLQMDDYSNSDTGKWWIEGDVYCSQWRKLRDGAKGCWDVTPAGGDEYDFVGRDGMRDLTVRISKN